MTDLLDYLKYAAEAEASDLFIAAGAPVSVKLDGRIRPIGEQRLTPQESERLIRELYMRADRPFSRLDGGDDDFSFAVSGLARFRVSAYRQRGSLAAVVRLVAFRIPDWQALRIPERVMELAELSHGMVLVTGTAGSGKSTTQACLIDRINRTRQAHIITLEDPIEFLHRNDRSIVSQRELGIDTADCLTALRTCLRQAPDVILLGEMRDQETVHTAMTAAETGHLLITTLHTRGAANAIDRIVDAFPGVQQAQVRIQLSMALCAVVSQQLLPDVHGGLVPAFELMYASTAVRNLIREGKTHLLGGVLAAGAGEGMVSMDGSILELYRTGEITRETALDHAASPDWLRRRLAEADGEQTLKTS